MNFENVFGLAWFDEIEIVVRVVENVAVNQDPATWGRTVAAADAAERICALLHQFQPDSANGPMSARKPAITLRNDPQHLSYECHFKASGGLTSAPSSGSRHRSSRKSSGTVTLTCATTGAAMFYTLDGSNPMPRNGTFYTAPFTPGAGTHFESARLARGLFRSSDIASATTATNNQLKHMNNQRICDLRYSIYAPAKYCSATNVRRILNGGANSIPDQSLAQRA